MRISAAQTRRPPLSMRVGMNTGEVVVRSIRKDDLAYRLCAGGAFHQPGGAHGAVGDAGVDSDHGVYAETNRRLF